ncbi:MAG: alpha/beta hydrolase [Deltaproteobacteria bacterium]|nr:alpha/beta hydrolase [Deltaproteobacteria bacterium]
MLFITNREMVKGLHGFSFHLDNNAPGNSVLFCEAGEKGHKMIDSACFMGQMKESEYKQILFYIHGYSNLPEPDIFPRAKKLQAMLDKFEPGLALVVPIIWPCDNDLGAIKDYWDDQQAADASAFSFARLLQKFIAWRGANTEDEQCFKRVNILAHSMGNRVLRRTLFDWDRYHLANGVPMLFRNIFMMAADVVNETLEKGKAGEHIPLSARNVVSYYASDDMAMPASKITNLKNKIVSRRLGMTGPEDMSKVPDNVYAIDCDDFNNSYDFPTGHCYFLDDGKGKPGEAFLHMASCIKTGRVRSEKYRRLILAHGFTKKENKEMR